MGRREAARDGPPRANRSPSDEGLLTVVGARDCTPVYAITEVGRHELAALEQRLLDSVE